MSKWLESTLAWMRTLPRHEPQGAALDRYEGPPRSEVVFHNVQATEALAPAPSQPSTPTPLAEVRAGVARVKAQMQAEREGRDVLRRVRTEIARDFAYAVKYPPPDGYTLALAEHGAPPEDWQPDGGCPEPYTLALGEIVSKRSDGTPVRLPEGDAPPDGYALALEARRSSDREVNDN